VNQTTIRKDEKWQKAERRIDCEFGKEMRITAHIKTGIGIVKQKQD
jgi:hypothetical protein